VKLFRTQPNINHKTHHKSTIHKMAASKPWADTPFTLIPLPARATSIISQADTTAIFLAREMVYAHNGMLRALNSIYLQAPYVKKLEDVKDLLQYTHIWYRWIHEHHDKEEEILFPMFERISGVKGLMEQNVAQHDAFVPGLEELGRYAKETPAKDYDAQKLREIIDRFGPALTTHLTEEIDTLMDMKKYDTVAIMKGYSEFEEELRKGEKVF
jgi:hemerythrin-like domain-containing protein